MQRSDPLADGRLVFDPVRRRLLALVVASGALLAAAAAAQTPPGGPGWNQLTPQQREALAPLSDQWATFPADNKKKWLEIAARYPQMSPEGRARMQARMGEYARLTPEQRRTARENFQRAYELPLESRESAVQQYKALPDDKKKELSTDSGKRKDAVRSPETR